MSTIPKLPSTFIALLLLFLLTLPATAGNRGGDDHHYHHRDPPSSHLNFFRQAAWCGDDPGRACSNGARNPWGGRTCCFGRVCRDTLRDRGNCGGCGKKCRFGLHCCDGECVDTRNDPRHCGACFQECPSGGRYCSFGMCDYAG